MKKSVFFAILSLILLASCQSPRYVCPDGTAVDNPSICPKKVICGDNICETQDEVSYCPQDCDVQARQGRMPNCAGEVPTITQQYSCFGISRREG